MSDLVERGANTYDKSMAFVRNGFKASLNYILILALVLLTAVLSFAQIALVDGITNSFWIELAYTLVINMASALIFINQGEDNEKKKNKRYQDNLFLWGQRTKKLQDEKRLTDFNKFCRKRSLEIAKAKQESYIELASIDIDYYNNNLKDLTKEQLLKCTNLESGIKDKTKNDIYLTKEQIKYILKARKTPKFVEINPSVVLAGLDTNSQYASLKHHLKYKSKAISFKFIYIIMYSIMLVSVVIMPTDQTGWYKIFKFIERITGIIISSITGFYTGMRQIRAENNENKEKILFIDEFLEGVN